MQLKCPYCAHEIPASDQALYLEQEIERFLNIKDAPIAGEMVS